MPGRLQGVARGKNPEIGDQAATISARRMPAPKFVAAENDVGRKWLSRAASVTSFVSAPAVIGFLGLLLLPSPSRPPLLQPTAMPAHAIGPDQADVEGGLDAGPAFKSHSKPAVPAQTGNLANPAPSRVDQRSAGRLGPELPDAAVKSPTISPREVPRSERKAE